jgi:hypothetical protein
MRGKDEQQLDVFSYVSPEQRVPQDHPLRPLRVMTDEALRELQPRFHSNRSTNTPIRSVESVLNVSVRRTSTLIDRQTRGTARLTMWP